MKERNEDKKDRKFCWEYDSLILRWLGGKTSAKKVRNLLFDVPLQKATLAEAPDISIICKFPLFSKRSSHTKSQSLLVFHAAQVSITQNSSGQITANTKQVTEGENPRIKGHHIQLACLQANQSNWEESYPICCAKTITFVDGCPATLCSLSSDQRDP